MVENLKYFFFTFTGRYNRSRYFFSMLALSLGLGGLSGFLAVFLQAVNLDYLGIAIYILVIPLIFIGQISIGIRRLHDLDLSGWWYLLSFLLFINIFFGIYLLFFKGTAGDNRFGSDPLAAK